MKTNPGRRVTIYEMTSLVGQAFLKAMMPKNILAGFQTSGIFPFNDSIFSEHDFLPSSITDAVSNIFTGAASFLSTEAHNLATSSMLARDEQHLVETSHIRTPSDIIPLPKAEPRKTMQKRRTKQSAILTDTPEQEKLKDREKQKISQRRKVCNSKKRKLESEVTNESNSSDDDPVPLDTDSGSADEEPGNF